MKGTKRADQREGRQCHGLLRRLIEGEKPVPPKFRNKRHLELQRRDSPGTVGGGIQLK